MSMLDMLQQRLGGDAVQQISQRLGTDPGTTQTAIAAALPMLVGALAHNAKDPSKAGALANALQKDHDGSILDNVTGYLGGQQNAGASTDGAGILGHVLGGRQETVQKGLGQVTGIDSGKAGMLLSMLAPLVMGALGKSARERGLDPGGLAGMLGGEQQAAAKAAPSGVMGMLGKFLDKDGDGSIMDDIGGMIGSRFGK
jgi:hypothetical protein